MTGPIVILGMKPAPFGSFIVRGPLPIEVVRRCHAVPANDGDLRRWQRRVRDAATSAAMSTSTPPISGPAVMRAIFYLPRPPYHFSKDGAIRPGVALFPIERRRDDVDKFLRAIFDAVSGVLVDDDARFVRAVIEKRYAATQDRAGVSFEVRRFGRSIR